MAQFEWVHAAWLALAIVLEIVANVFLKFSDGFRRKIFGLLSWRRCWLPLVRFLKPLKGSTCLSLMHCGAGLVLPPR
ncbi:multidrug resistance protein [Escherichia coli]|nr:multidrug resistance protein [Escherichia coli]